jgi:DNA-binding transcriptional regulator LsrR (DeoR family)
MNDIVTKGISVMKPVSAAAITYKMAGRVHVLFAILVVEKAFARRAFVNETHIESTASKIRSESRRPSLK